VNSNGPTLSPEQAYRRAGGRRRYNLRRQEVARARRAEVQRLLDLYGERGRGTRARIARELSVSEATVSRDVREILEFQRLYKAFRSGKLKL
jgi:predicted transcriptional regulator